MATCGCGQAVVVGLTHSTPVVCWSCTNGHERPEEAGPGPNAR